MTAFDGRFRDLGTVPTPLISALRDWVAGSEHLWRYADPRFTSAHPHSAHIVFRFPPRYPATHEDARPTEHWQPWADVLTPLLALVADGCGLESPGFAKVMLSRLDAGGTVPRHVDTNPSSQVPHKVHLPVITNPDVAFVVGGERRHLPVGCAVEINNMLEHSVENRGRTPRVHLIVETYDRRATRPAGVS